MGCEKRVRKQKNAPGFSADAAISARREVRVALDELKRTALKARGARAERRASILLLLLLVESCVDGETGGDAGSECITTTTTTEASVDVDVKVWSRGGEMWGRTWTCVLYSCAPQGE
jgi:hypothetical protein